MGAEYFTVRSTGKTAQEAFNAAIEEAVYDHGHSGYTGTIAEKDTFIMKGNCQTTKEAFDLAESFELLDDAQVTKWGPAGCIKVLEKENLWVFFGWASC